MKYNVKYNGLDYKNEKYTMIGTVEICESSSFKYGNGKQLKFNVSDKEKGYSYTESFDIRYDTRYKKNDEISYIKEIIMDEFSKADKNTIVIEKSEE